MTVNSTLLDTVPAPVKVWIPEPANAIWALADPLPVSVNVPPASEISPDTLIRPVILPAVTTDSVPLDCAKLPPMVSVPVALKSWSWPVPVLVTVKLPFTVASESLRFTPAVWLGQFQVKFPNCWPSPLAGGVVLLV